MACSNGRCGNCGVYHAKKKAEKPGAQTREVSPEREQAKERAEVRKKYFAESRRRVYTMVAQKRLF